MFHYKLEAYKDPPAPYRWLSTNTSSWWIHEDYYDLFLEQGIRDFSSFVNIHSDATREVEGRNPLQEISFPELDDGVLLRHYSRGGILRWVNEDLYLGSPRSFQETRVTLQVQEAGIPTRDILAAGVHNGPGPFHREDLLIREIPQVRTVQEVFLAAKEMTGFTAMKHTLLQRMGTIVDRLHKSGVYHPDLNMMNFLYRPEESQDDFELFLIDFDRCTIHDPLRHTYRRRNIRRMMRSLERLRRKSFFVTKSDLVRLYQSYAQNNALFREYANSYLTSWKYQMKIRDLFGS